MLALARIPEEKWVTVSESDAKVKSQMRLSNPLLLASLGVLLAAASCTLITDVDRSKIPDGLAGAPSGGDGHAVIPQAGQPGTSTGGSKTNMGGAPDQGGNGPAQGGAGAGPIDNGAGAGGVSAAGAPGMAPAGAGGI